MWEIIDIKETEIMISVSMIIKIKRDIREIKLIKTIIIKDEEMINFEIL